MELFRKNSVRTESIFPAESGSGLRLHAFFYENHDILIMDEPTAAMDIRFEKEFYDLVFSYLKDKTIPDDFAPTGVDHCLR